jgi:two-component system sensor histidine kinase YesM
MRRKKFKNMYQTILSRIMQLLIVFVFLPIAALLLWYNFNTQKAVHEEIYQINLQALITESNSVERMLDAMLSSSNIISLDSHTNELLNQARGGDNTRFEQNRIHQDIIAKLTDVKNYVLPGEGEITLIDSNGAIYSTASLTNSRTAAEVRSLPWYKETIALNGYINWFASPQDADFAQKDVPYFSMARLLKAGYSADEERVLLIHVRNDTFLSKSDTEGIHGSIYYVYAEDGTVFMSNEVSRIGTKLEDDWIRGLPERQEMVVAHDQGERYMMGYKLPNFNWKLAMFYDPSVIKEQLSSARGSLFLIALTLFVIFLMLIYLFSFFITRPMSRLTQSIQMISSSNLDVHAPIAGPLEVKILTRHFNQMVRRLYDSIERNKEERRKKELARYQALQAQINPHFLFNTLNTIKWSAYMSEAPNVAEMISKLGRLLEVSFRQDRELVAIRDEIEYLKLYIDIQNIRFNNNYELRLDIPEPLMDMRIPALSLQPIVENSIIHGYKDGSIPGVIGIKGEVSGSQFMLHIQDDGTGMKKSCTHTSIHQLEPGGDNYSQSHGIGLSNVADRIQIQFGEQYGGYVTSRAGAGTTITLLLPMQGGDKYVN